MLAALPNGQRKYLIDSTQVYESYVEAYRQSASFRYGMSWKKSNGKFYLFRASGRNGYGKSLLPKRPATEQIFSECHTAKIRNDERLHAITARLNEFARINKALRLGRLPTVVSKLMRKIEKTFAPMRMNTFCVANAQEFMVELITPPREMSQSEPVRFSDDDLIAVEVRGVEWLMNSPRFSAVCIGEDDGWPCRMVFPDPRAFCVYKAWFSKRIDPGPIKKPRDLGLAHIIRQLTQ